MCSPNRTPRIHSSISLPGNCQLLLTTHTFYSTSSKTILFDTVGRWGRFHLFTIHRGQCFGFLGRFLDSGNISIHKKSKCSGSGTAGNAELSPSCIFLDTRRRGAGTLCNCMRPCTSDSTESEPPLQDTPLKTNRN